DLLHRPIVGRESSAQVYHGDEQLPADQAPVKLQVTNLTRAGQYEDVSFDVRARDVVGIAGVIGSGRDEHSRVPYSAEPSTSGSIVGDGKPVKFASPVDAVSAGFGYIPAERRIEGIADGLSVAENICLVAPQTAAWGPFRNPKKALEIAGAWI